MIQGINIVLFVINVFKFVYLTVNIIYCVIRYNHLTNTTFIFTICKKKLMVYFTKYVSVIIKRILKFAGNIKNTTYCVVLKFDAN